MAIKLRRFSIEPDSKFTIFLEFQDAMEGKYKIVAYNSDGYKYKDSSDKSINYSGLFRKAMEILDPKMQFLAVDTTGGFGLVMENWLEDYKKKGRTIIKVPEKYFESAEKLAEYIKDNTPKGLWKLQEESYDKWDRMKKDRKS